jgi:hypothetical protein
MPNNKSTASTTEPSAAICRARTHNSATARSDGTGSGSGSVAGSRPS